MAHRRPDRGADPDAPLRNQPKTGQPTNRVRPEVRRRHVQVHRQQRARHGHCRGLRQRRQQRRAALQALARHRHRRAQPHATALNPTRLKALHQADRSRQDPPQLAAHRQRHRPRHRLATNPQLSCLLQGIIIIILLLLLLFLLSYYHYYYYYHIIIFIIIIILLLLLLLVFVEIMPDKIILDHKKSYLVIFSQF